MTKLFIMIFIFKVIFNWQPLKVYQATRAIGTILSGYSDYFYIRKGKCKTLWNITRKCDTALQKFM